ncbi:MAG: polysaccharide biosynthesis/export family protein [Balneolales bacterium]
MFDKAQTLPFRYSIACFTTLIVLSITSQTFSQSANGSDNESSDSGSFINLDGLIGGEPFYFIDELSLGLGQGLSAQEFAIDENEYRLGMGDIFSIEFTGSLNGSMRGIRVNPQGDVTLPNVGTVKVKDITIAEARDKIHLKVQEKYKDTEVSVSLDQARPVTIHVTGDVPFPGKREVNALTRVDQAIYPAFFAPEPEVEGEEEIPQIGSLINSYSSEFLNQKEYTLRNITISTQNGEVRNADLIAYFKAGDTDSNPLVSDGDVITIHRMRRYTPTITISGAVKTAENLEYRAEDTLGDLITISNGYAHDASKQEIYIFRLEDGNINRIIIDAENTDLYSVSLKPNDRVVVPFDRELRNNKAAWVYGEANNPGNYPIIDGQTTALDLLQMADGVSVQALSHAAYLVRGNPSSSDVSGTMEFDPELLKRTSDQLAQGFEYLDLEVALNRNQIFLDLSNEEQLSNIQIFDGDNLFIPKDDQSVYLMGQIKSPGYYPYNATQSVNDYISRAGNFALAAEESRIFVIKSGSRSWYRPEETSLESGDIIFVDRVPYDELQAHRAYDMQVRGQRNSNIQLIMTGLATMTSIITTYVAITR